MKHEFKDYFKDLIKEADDAQFDLKLKALFKQKYPGFVAGLGSSIADPKFRKFIKDTDTEKSAVKLISIPVRKLLPTQSEIDVDKSLAFSLSTPQAAAYALKDGAHKIASPIITFNGRYIVDGHHRWSQLYALNKNASIVAYNFTNEEIKQPLDALKVLQVAIIGAGATKIPKEEAKGLNLLKESEEALKQYIIENIDERVVDVFAKMKQLNDKQAIANYIWPNIEQMQATSKPVQNAPLRSMMPQADKVPGGLIKTIATLQQGVPMPIAEQLSKLIRKAIKEELKKHK